MSFYDRFIASWFYQKLVAITDQIILPGFDGQSLYIIGKFLVNGLKRSSITMRASAVAFNFLLALFPGVIFMFTLLPYFSIDNFQDTLLAELHLVLPTEAYELLHETIVDLISNPRGGLLSAGFFSMLYFSTNGIRNVLEAFDASANVVDVSGFWKQRLSSALLTVIITVLMILAGVLIVFGKSGVGYLVDNHYIESSTNAYLLRGLSYLVIISVFYFTNSFMYFLGPTWKTKWKFFSAGSSFATVLMVLISGGFSYYVNNFAQYNKFYGSLGTIVVLMMWIYLYSLILLLGFELNASIRINKNAND